MTPTVPSEAWPALPFEEWKDTYATLHMWTQVVGKIRLVRAPMVNHWWHVTLYLTARGLTTSPIPHGSRTFQMEFDFIAHQLRIETSDGELRTLPLTSRSVADFYADVMKALEDLVLRVRIWTMPVEVESPVSFEEDRRHATYVPEQANRFWRILVSADRVLQRFRSGYLGKVSPSHFFWGSFDLAQTRFSGRPAPIHPGTPNVADFVTREAYSHEVSSCGFWPGAPALPEPIFYAYAYPEPPGYSEARVRPEPAFYSGDLKEYLLRYDDVRALPSPEDSLLAFFQSTYEAAAERGGWDRRALERGSAAAR